MFKAHFLFSSAILTKNIKIVFYFMLTSDEKTMTSGETIKTIYKVESNKASKMNKITNRILQRFVDVATKQFRFFFDKCI